MRQTASCVSVPGLGRWVTVALSVSLLWIFGMAAEARADGTVTEGITATTDVTSGSTIPEEGTSAATEPADTSAGTEPTDSTPTTEPTDPTPTTEPTDPTPTTDPAATAPPPDPPPAPEPITPVTDPTPTTETPPETQPPPVSPEPASSGLKSSIVVLDEPPASALLFPSPVTPLAALMGISPAATSRGSELTRTPASSGDGHPAPAAPNLPRLPAPDNPSAPANPAPGGVGGTGSSSVGLLAALFALAFAGLLGEVLPLSMAALRPPDLAFHTKRPG